MHSICSNPISILLALKSVVRKWKITMIGLLNFGYHQASNSSAILITQRIKRVGKIWRWDRPHYLTYKAGKLFLTSGIQPAFLTKCWWLRTVASCFLSTLQLIMHAEWKGNMTLMYILEEPSCELNTRHMKWRSCY